MLCYIIFVWILKNVKIIHEKIVYLIFVLFHCMIVILTKRQ